MTRCISNQMGFYLIVNHSISRDSQPEQQKQIHFKKKQKSQKKIELNFTTSISRPVGFILCDICTEG